MDVTNQEIVVGYDGSPFADVALEWAAETAARVNVPVRAVIVDDLYASQWKGPGGRTDEEQAKDVKHALASAGVTGGLERRSGPVVTVLLEAARSASMLVVGGHGHGHVAEMMIGSVSQHVATHAACPVVVVREQAQPSATRIVVGIDGSTGSTAALDFACRRAELTGEVVVAVHAWKVGSVLLDGRGQPPHDLGPAIAERERFLSEAVAGARSDHPDVTLLLEAIPAAPGQALVDASATASLVVTGSRGRGAFAGMLLGSVSHEVLCRAQCPVAIVR
jgi:nucleotide-binding universal stress UspA family protein